MNRTATFFACLLVLSPVVAGALPSEARAVPRLETVLGADADFTLLIEDVGASREAWSTSPWGGLWRDPGMRAWTDSIRTGLTRTLGDDGEERLAELLDRMQGQAALTIGIDLGDPGEKPSVRWALVAGFRDGKALDSLESDILRMRGEDTLPDREESVNGVSVRTRVTDSGEEVMSRAYDGGIGILGRPAGQVKALAAALKGKAKGPRLAASSGYRSMQKHAPRAGASFLIHMAGLSRYLTRAMEGAMEESPNASMLGVTADGVSRALALDSIDALYATLDEAENETVLHSGVVYHGDTGIMQLLAYLPGPCLRPDFIPQDALMATTSRFSITKMYDGLMGMLESLSPGMATMVRAQLQQMTMAYGLDLEKDLLANLGENTFGAYLPASGDAPMPDQIFGIEIKDKDRLQDVLHAIYASMGVTEDPVAVDRVGDIPVFAVLPQETDQNVYYAVTGRHLVVCRGASQSLVRVLEGIRKPGRSIWNRSDLEPYFERLPENPSGVTYYDLGTVFETTIAQMKESEHRPTMDAPDPAAIRRYLGPLVGGEYRTDDGMLGIAYLVHTRR